MNRVLQLSDESNLNAEPRCSLPTADETHKLLRNEAHLDRQLYRAMDQLERLQRQRRSEKVPSPLNISLERRRWLLLRNKANNPFVFNAG